MPCSLGLSIPGLQEVTAWHQVAWHASFKALDVPAEQNAVSFEPELQAQPATVSSDFVYDFIGDAVRNGNGVVADNLRAVSNAPRLIAVPF